METEANNSPKSKWVYIIIGFIGLLTLVNVFVELKGETVELSIFDLEEMLEQDRVVSMTIVNRVYVEVHLKEETKDKYIHTIGAVKKFEQWLEEKQQNVPANRRLAVGYELRNNSAAVILSWAIPIGALIILLLLLVWGLTYFFKRS